MQIYSHVALVAILTEPRGSEVTSHLGIEPTRIEVSHGYSEGPDGKLAPRTSYSWFLESPKGATHQVIPRISALVDLIEPIGGQLATLDEKFRPWIDVVYKVTPQHPHGIAGEFDWISIPHVLMGRLAALRLSLSYEVFWHDHPDWKLAWHQKLLRKLTGRKGGEPGATDNPDDAQRLRDDR